MRSRDREKISAELLRRTLAAEGNGLNESAESCPEPEILAAYFESSLDAQETAHWESHFSQCSRCRDQLAAMVRADESVATAAARQQSSSSRWFRTFDWRWLAPAVAALIIAAIWIARWPATKTAGDQHPLVAMSSQQVMPAAPPPQEFARNKKVIPPSPPPPAKTVPGIEREAAPVEKQSTTPPRTQQDDKELALNNRSIYRTRDSLAKKSAPQPGDFGAAVSTGALQGNSPQPKAAPPEPAPPNNAGNDAPQQRAMSETVTVESETASLEPQPGAAAQGVVSGASAAQRVSQRAPSGAAAGRQNLVAEIVEPASGNLITTPDPKILWRITGSGGVVEFSNDGGTSWRRQQLRSFQPNPRITAGYAPSAKICWLVGRNGVILLTRDASHWTPIPPPVGADFSSINARDNFSATVTTTDGRKFSTDDAGDHWTSEP